jgi:hypothetical protein
MVLTIIKPLWFKICRIATIMYLQTSRLICVPGMREPVAEQFAGLEKWTLSMVQGTWDVFLATGRAAVRCRAGAGDGRRRSGSRIRRQRLRPGTRRPSRTDASCNKAPLRTVAWRQGRPRDGRGPRRRPGTRHRRGWSREGRAILMGHGRRRWVRPSPFSSATAVGSRERAMGTWGLRVNSYVANNGIAWKNSFP